MSEENNKAISRRFFEEVFSRGKLEVADELFASNHRTLGPGALPDLPNGPAGVKALVQFYRKAFPDTQFTIDEQIADGDRVVTRWTVKGTQKGEMEGLGIPVTGKPVTISGVSVDHFMGGKIVDTWGLFDQLGMMQQLGVVPGQNR